MAKQYRTDLLASVHETMEAMHEVGGIDKTTMRRFDALCLTAIEPIGPEDIKALRERERVSQAVLARHLNVTTGLVSQWERGEKKPGGAALKLLTLVRKRGLSAVA